MIYIVCRQPVFEKRLELCSANGLHRVFTLESCCLAQVVRD